MIHTCHAYGCQTACPPAMLMCRACWSLVSPATQTEVYRTVKLRGPRTDKTWAPWWRAQALACNENAEARGVTTIYGGLTVTDKTRQALAFADRLESR